MLKSSYFTIRNEISPSIQELLNSTVLGSNGAKYRHLDTPERIKEADDPLFLTLERNEKVLGNVTFCQRGDFWYVRYFAFNSLFQAGIKTQPSRKNKSILKNELNQFFDDVLEGKFSEKPISSLYAYIDPKNDRSKWMSENFDFKVIGHLATQTYSRINPKQSERLTKEFNWTEIEATVLEKYGKHAFYYDTHSCKPPYYILRNAENEIISFAKVTTVNWEILRLPGKMGGLLTKMIPFIPFLNKVIKPKHHTFLVPEIVYVKDNDPVLLNELFEAILFAEKRTLMLWWNDEKDHLYTSVKDKMNWGILHKIIGVSRVDVVERKKPTNLDQVNSPIFISAWDFI